MSEDNFYDEDKAIAYIRNILSTEQNNKLADDDILLIIDIIWDYYDSVGMLSLSDIDDEEDEVDLTKLLDFVYKECKKIFADGINRDDLSLIVKGELDYEKSLDDII
jgi:hypothetical protein